MALWPVAPHEEFGPEAQYAKTPVKLTAPDPSFNEADVSDKPAWLRSWFPTTPSRELLGFDPDEPGAHAAERR